MTEQTPRTYPGQTDPEQPEKERNTPVEGEENPNADNDRSDGLGVEGNPAGGKPKR